MSTQMKMRVCQFPLLGNHGYVISQCTVKLWYVALLISVLLFTHLQINDARAHLNSLYAKQLGKAHKAEDSKAGSVPHQVKLGKPKD